MNTGNFNNQNRPSDFLNGTGISSSAFWSFVEERIFSLPGLRDPQEDLTVLLTGSRANGLQHETSDVDIDVLCPKPLYDELHAQALAAGLIQSPNSFFCIVDDKAGKEYFGKDLGNPHFSLTPIETVQAHFDAYEDVWMWIWTHARIASDPQGRFAKIRKQFTGYPETVRVRKTKYHWLAAGYNAIDIFPHGGGAALRDNLLAAVAGLANAILETLRVFFLVEDRPYPYPEKLLRCARDTALGREFCPLLTEASESIAGFGDSTVSPEERLQNTFERLFCSDLSEKAARLSNACESAMIDAGVPEPWVRADYENIDQLLQGQLGPFEA